MLFYPACEKDCVIPFIRDAWKPKILYNREIFDLEVVAYALNRGLVVPELLRIKRQP